MTDPIRKRLKRTTLIYLVLLLYIIAALVWWFISLEKQNQQMADLSYSNLQARSNSMELTQLNNELQEIEKEVNRNTAKYIAEGITFLILILIGAAFVYRSVRRQFSTQQQQQNFMMAVTHELKTPLSVSRLNLETMQKYTLDAEKQKKLIKMTIEETARLDFLINNILISAQLEGGGYKNMKEDLDLSDLLKDCIQHFRERYPDREFREEVVEDMDVKGDPLLLQMMINNLLSNAIKYSPRESPVIARLEYEPGAKIELSISDEGPGIPENEKANIFSKFYRIGNETTRKTQGTGIGLYLCRIIAKAHNADIKVTNNEPSGSTFVVTFYG